MTGDAAVTAPAPERIAASSMTVLTGASGWFGRAYLRGIAEREASGEPGRAGNEVRVLVAEPGEVPMVLAALPRARVFVGDVADEPTVSRLLRGAEGASVVHAAGVIHPRRLSDFDRVNLGGTSAILAAARHAGALRLVHVSSNSSVGVNATPTDAFRHDEPFDPYMAYGRSKMRAELAVRAAHDDRGLQTVVVRPPWFYGPEQPLRQTTFFTLVRKGRFPMIGGGDQRRSMVYVDNLVQGVLLAQEVAAAGGEAFWVADARPYAVHEIVHTVRQVLQEEGFDVSRRQVSLPRVVGRVAETVDGALQARGVYHQEFHVLGEMDKTIACDIGRTTEVLGYRPGVDLLEGMRRSVRWCVSQGARI